MNVQGMVVSHELLDEHLDLVRSDADALVRATREICPTVCMPESEHVQPDGRTVLRNHAVSRQEIEVEIMQDRMDGIEPMRVRCTLMLRRHDRTTMFILPIAGEMLATKERDLPGFVSKVAEQFQRVVSTDTPHDPGHEHLREVGILSRMLGGESSCILLPTPWNDAVLCPWNVNPPMPEALRRMIVERTGRRIAIESRPEDVKSWTHTIAGETMHAIDCDAMEMMRISSRWDVGEQLA